MQHKIDIDWLIGEYKKNKNIIFKVSSFDDKIVVIKKIIKEIIEDDKTAIFFINKDKDRGVIYKSLINSKICNTFILGVYDGQTKQIGRITLSKKRFIPELPMRFFDIIIFDAVYNYSEVDYNIMKRYNFKKKIAFINQIKNWKILENFEYNIKRIKKFV